MENYLLSFLSVLLFCVSCHFCVKTIITPLGGPIFGTFSKRALRVEKAYKAMAWGCLAAFMLSAMVLSFLEVFNMTLYSPTMLH